MPKGSTKRRPRTQADLLDAALDTFAEFGYQTASIEEICRRAGYSRGAFYSNYGSREELFFALYDVQTARVIDRYAELATTIATDRLTLEDIAELAARVDVEERKWYLVFAEFMLYAIRTPAAAETLTKRDEDLRAKVAELLAGALADAGLHPDIDIDQLVRMITIIREGGLPRTMMAPMINPAGQIEAQLIRLLLSAATKPNSAA